MLICWDTILQIVKYRSTTHVLIRPMFYVWNTRSVKDAFVPHWNQFIEFLAVGLRVIVHYLQVLFFLLGAMLPACYLSVVCTVVLSKRWSCGPSCYSIAIWCWRLSNIALRWLPLSFYIILLSNIRLISAKYKCVIRRGNFNRYTLLAMHWILIRTVLCQTRFQGEPDGSEWKYPRLVSVTSTKNDYPFPSST